VVEVDNKEEMLFEKGDDDDDDESHLRVGFSVIVICKGYLPVTHRCLVVVVANILRWNLDNPSVVFEENSEDDGWKRLFFCLPRLVPLLSGGAFALSELLLLFLPVLLLLLLLLLTFNFLASLSNSSSLTSSFNFCIKPL